MNYQMNDQAKEIKDEETKETTEAIDKENAQKELEQEPKIEVLDSQPIDLQQELDKQKDKLLRTMAEFDNYRKRTTKEKASMYDMGVKDTIEKILPVVDNFDRATQSLDQNNDLHKGILMIYRQMALFLAEVGLVPIDCIDKPFDPNLHNAIGNESDTTKPHGVVLAEMQRGYTYKEKVVRHSIVKVNHIDI